MMRTNSFRPIKIVAMLAGFFLQPLYAQWPQWRGEMRDGSSSETHFLKNWPSEGPRLVWVTDSVIGDGFSSAIIQDKMIYTTGKIDSVEVMTAIGRDGKIVWQKKIGKAYKEDWPQSRSTPTFYNGKLYAVTVAGQMTCLDAKSGNMVWTINIPQKFGTAESSYCESPLVAENQVIITPGGLNTMMAALNSTTGETIWTSESIGDTSGFVSPMLIQGSEKKLIITSTKKHIIAVDFNTGKISWKEKSSANGFVPLPYKNEIYFSKLGGDGRMISINADQNSFNTKWSDTMKVNCLGGGVRIGNRIYAALGKSKGLFCLDWETGKTLSINKEVSYAHFVVADSMIYGYEGNGRIVLVKPKGDDTELVSSFKIKHGKGQHLAHMSIGDDLLFIRHGKYLMAYDVKQP